MLSIAFGCANLNAHKIDDPRDKIPVVGHEYFHKFADAQGRSCVAMSLYEVKTSVVQRALMPSENGVYDLREFESELRKQVLKNRSWFGRHKGKLGVAVGVAAGSMLMLAAIMDGFFNNYRSPSKKEQL